MCFLGALPCLAAPSLRARLGLVGLAALALLSLLPPGAGEESVVTRSSPLEPEPKPGYVAYADAAVDGQGRLHVCWLVSAGDEDDEDEIRYAQIRDSESSSAVAPVTLVAGKELAELEMRTDRNGKVLAVWEDLGRRAIIGHLKKPNADGTTQVIHQHKRGPGVASLAGSVLGPESYTVFWTANEETKFVFMEVEGEMVATPWVTATPTLYSSVVGESSITTSKLTELHPSEYFDAFAPYASRDGNIHAIVLVGLTASEHGGSSILYEYVLDIGTNKLEIEPTPYFAEVGQSVWATELSNGATVCVFEEESHGKKEAQMYVGYRERDTWSDAIPLGTRSGFALYRYWFAAIVQVGGDDSLVVVCPNDALTGLDVYVMNLVSGDIARHQIELGMRPRILAIAGGAGTLHIIHGSAERKPMYRSFTIPEPRQEVKAID